jgi:hypothetical protein
MREFLGSRSRQEKKPRRAPRDDAGYLLAGFIANQVRQRRPFAPRFPLRLAQLLG